MSTPNDAYIDLSWEAGGASQWEVRFRKSGEATIQTVRTSQATVRLGGLPRDTAYAVSVAAINSAGVPSIPSPEITVRTAIDITPPSAPTGTAAIGTPRGGVFTWAANREPDLAQYEVAVALAGGPFVSQGYVPGTSYTYTAPAGTPVGTDIQFKVRALDSSGNPSTFSTVSSASTTSTNGISFSELTVGELLVMGEITAEGGLQTSNAGERLVLAAEGLKTFDNTLTDYGAGPGVTVHLGSDGNVFFSGKISASVLQSLPGMVPSARMDLTGIPSLTFNDGGFNRVTLGEYVSVTDGVTRYGMQVLDALGHLIFDSNTGGVGGGGPVIPPVPQTYTYVYSFPGSLITRVGSIRVYVDSTIIISEVRASVGVAASGTSVVLDIHKNGSTIYTTTANRPTIAPGANTVIAALPDVTAMTSGDYFTVDIVQIGTPAPGANLTVQIKGS